MSERAAGIRRERTRKDRLGGSAFAARVHHPSNQHEFLLILCSFFLFFLFSPLPPQRVSSDCCCRFATVAHLRSYISQFFFFFGFCVASGDAR